jgi:hypothetical protein
MSIVLRSGKADGRPFDKAMFGLPAADFVEAVCAFFDVDEARLPAQDRSALVQSLSEGRSRLDVFGAISRTSSAGRLATMYDSPLNAIMHDSDAYFVQDVLERYAPDDDEAFLIHACQQILGRRNSELEHLACKYDLRRGTVTRGELLDRLVRQARSEGRLIGLASIMRDSPELSPAPPRSPSAIGWPGMLGINAKGQEEFTLCRSDARGGWLVLKNHLMQDISIVDGFWKVGPGFLLAGPKYTLTPGTWQLSVEITQPDDARLELDVVANSALDVSFATTIIGSFSGSILVRIQPHHLFNEIRLAKPDQPAEAMFVRIDKIELVRLGAGLG